MRHFFIFTLLIMFQISSDETLAGKCSCKNQIDNASAEVTGSCSKVWSNNHCTLKEDGSTTSDLRTVANNETSSAIVASRFNDTLSSIGVFTNENIRDYLNSMSRFDYLEQVRNLCRNRQVIPSVLFETFVTASLTSVSQEPEIKLLVSNGLFSETLRAAREYNIAAQVCQNDQIESKDMGDIEVKFGQACFAAGTRDENFAINFSEIRGCPAGLEF